MCIGVNKLTNVLFIAVKLVACCAYIGHELFMHMDFEKRTAMTSAVFTILFTPEVRGNIKFDANTSSYNVVTDSFSHEYQQNEVTQLSMPVRFTTQLFIYVIAEHFVSEAICKCQHAQRNQMESKRAYI